MKTPFPKQPTVHSTDDVKKMNRSGIGVKIPASSIKRLSIYYRQLLILKEQQQDFIRSEKLATFCGVNSAQLRKDLSYFGSFGKRGTGYAVGILMESISKILGTDKIRPIVLLGVGSLGSALIAFAGFETQGFRFAAVGDSDPLKVGKSIRGHKCMDVPTLLAQIKLEKIKMAILAVPSEVAQNAAAQLIASGISAILNFAPVSLETPPGVQVSNIDLSVELKSLSFFLKNQ